MKGGARNNKPRAIRALHGSKVRPRHRHEVVAAPMERFEAPPGFTALEMELWTYYATELTAIRVLSKLDREALANFVILSGQVREIRQQQIRGIRGRQQASAVDARLRHYLSLQRLAAAELGLSPASRGRVQPISPKDERDALEDFITAPIHAVK